MIIASDSDYEVAGAVVGGIEALRAVKSLRRDLVLMGLSMPGMHGFEGIREIKACTLI